jgi:hypothetical protein
MPFREKQESLFSHREGQEAGRKKSDILLILPFAFAVNKPSSRSSFLRGEILSIRFRESV